MNEVSISQDMLNVEVVREIKGPHRPCSLLVLHDHCYTALHGLSSRQQNNDIQSISIHTSYLMSSCRQDDLLRNAHKSSQFALSSFT